LLKINDSYYASCSWDPDDNLKIWNKNDSSIYRDFKGHTNSVNAIILLNETIMVSGSTDGTIKFWDIFNSNESYKSISLEDSVESLSLITGTDYLVGGLDNGSLILVNINNNRTQLLKTSHTRKVTDLEYFKERKLLASASYDNYIYIIDMIDPFKDDLVKKLNTSSKQLTLIYASNYLVSGDWDGHVCL